MIERRFTTKFTKLQKSTKALWICVLCPLCVFCGESSFLIDLFFQVKPAINLKNPAASKAKGQKAAILQLIALFAYLKKKDLCLPVFKHRYKREEVYSCSK
jgi:hypothetical protein